MSHNKFKFTNLHNINFTTFIIMPNIHIDLIVETYAGRETLKVLLVYIDASKL